MDQRVSLITLAVADPARSKEFYEALGWKAGFTSKDIAFFQLNGIVLGLYRRTAFEAETGRTLSGGDGVALAINFAARDAVDAVLDEAVRAGGEIMRPAAATEWGGYSGSRIIRTGISTRTAMSGCLKPRRHSGESRNPVFRRSEPRLSPG